MLKYFFNIDIILHVLQLWCDQRNQARNPAAKAKAAQKMTGNIGTTIQLKDFDLRILSIFGGESSVGLLIMEVGLGDRPEVCYFFYRRRYIKMYGSCIRFVKFIMSCINFV